jgi:hypothetical protein
MTADITITEETILGQMKPLSGNGVAAFFQKIWRKWLSAWYNFCARHPKLSKIVHQIVFFLIFSNGVTLLQYIITLFLPLAFGIGLAGTEFSWPKLPMYKINGVQKYWSVLGYDIIYNAEGAVIIGGGLGYFIAFQIATFLAQCINFPLQRNITFKSQGNVLWQIFWYFIGWVLVSLFSNGINNLWLPLGAEYLPFAVYNIFTMVSMGGISMVIFFFIFLIIFPDLNSVEKRVRAKLDRLIKRSAHPDKIQKVQTHLERASKDARLFNAQKTLRTAAADASIKAMRYLALKNSKQKADGKAADDDYLQKLNNYYQAAATAVQKKQEAEIKLISQVMQ